MILVFLTIHFALVFIIPNTAYTKHLTALVGFFAFAILSILIHHQKIISYAGQITLVILCIHGPLYRILIKLFSIPLKMPTTELRANIFFALFVSVVTIAFCGLFHQLILKFVPWTVGAKKIKNE